MHKMEQEIWYSIMSCESERVEISMMVEIFAKNILGIDSTLVGVFDRTIIILMFGREFSESAFDLG